LKLAVIKKIELGAIQNVEVKIARNKKLVAQNIKEGALLNREDVSGSKEEKMSVSITKSRIIFL
jgi:hypothetical protein